MSVKKISTLIFSLALIVILAGCGGSKPPADIPSMEPESFGELIWPDHKLASLVPHPVSSIGEVCWEHEDEIKLKIGNVTSEDFLDYVGQCDAGGFSNIDSEGDAFFYARNANGYRIHLNYEESDLTMTILISDPLHVVEIEIDCLENLFFSRYDLDAYVDYTKLGSIEHGGEANYQVELEKGTHTLRVVSQEKEAVDGEYEFQVPDTTEIRCDVSCTSEQVELKVIKDVELPEQTLAPSEEPSEPIDTPTVSTEPQTTVPAVETEPPETTPSGSAATFYSTNDPEMAKNGNSGVFSYINRGPNYNTYWIIDFDEGYVYYFTDGNGNETCDRLEIESGDLNDVLIITYHDGDDAWSYGLHFHYKDHPSTLIVQDNDGFETEYMTTTLSEALEIRDSKTIHDY